MSWATSRALVGSTIAAAVTTAAVHNRLRTDLDREDAEAALRKDGGDGKLRCFEYVCWPSEQHGGASGYQRTVMGVEVTYTHFLDDANDAYGEMANEARLAMEALADPLVFPQLSPEGILTTDPGRVPLKLRTGQAALRLVFTFTLQDVEST